MSQGEEKEWERVLKRLEVLGQKVKKKKKVGKVTNKKKAKRGKSQVDKREIARMGLFVGSEEYLMRLVEVIDKNCMKNLELGHDIFELNRWFIDKNMRR